MPPALRRLLTTASLAELADLLAEWKEPAAKEADLTPSAAEAEALAWGGNG